MVAQRPEVFFPNGMRLVRHLQGKIQHRRLPRRDVRLAVIDRHLIGNRRLFRPNPENRAVGDHAILAIIGP